MLGVVRWFSSEKGYGFIDGHDNQQYFIHYKEISSPTSPRNLFDGQKVDFQPGKSEKGLIAQRVAAID